MLNRPHTHTQTVTDMTTAHGGRTDVKVFPLLRVGVQFVVVDCHLFLTQSQTTRQFVISYQHKLKDKASRAKHLAKLLQNYTNNKQHWKILTIKTKFNC